MSKAKKERHPAEDVEGIEMLSQPLITEEGFINPACMAELEAAIRNTPEIHERLAGEPEWATPWVTGLEDVVAGLAHAAVAGARGHVPPGLADVLSYLRVELLRGLFADPVIATEDEIILAELSLCEINKFLWDVLGDLPQFNAWNTRECLGDRWVDLSALLRNACLCIRDERRHMLAFDRGLTERRSKREEKQ